MKRNKDIILKLFTFIICLMLILWVALCSIQYKNDFDKNVDAYYKLVELCNEENKVMSDESCHTVITNGKPVMPDTFTIFFQLLINSNLSLIQLLGPIIVIILASYSFSREYNTGFFKNIIQRMSYKNYLKSIILRTYKYIWILPIFLIIIFIFSFLISGHFNVDLTLSYWPEYYIPISIMAIKNIFPFMIIFILNVIFNSIFYANIALITIKKSNNYIISVISSYLIFIFCDIFLEVLVGILILEKILHISGASNLFSLFNYLVYEGIPNIYLYTIYCFTLVIVSLVVVICVYHNKEEVIMKSEK